MKQDFKLTSASKNVLKLDGRFLMHIEVMGKRVMHPVFVCENLTQPAIMGMDLITKLSLNYNCGNKSFSINENHDTAAAIFVVSAETIPPWTAVPVKVKVQNNGSVSPPSSAYGITWIDSVRYPLLSGGPGIINVLSSTTNSMVMVKNCAPTAVTLERGEPIGFCELSTTTPIEVTSESLIAHLERTKTHAPPALSGHTARQFLADVNLTVPKSEKGKYEKLLVKNFDVFSKDKLDLGTANNFEHRITLSENQPSYIKQFRIPEAHRDALVSQVKDWLKLGIIEPANSRFNSPIFVVPKKDGTMRFVLDFRALNSNSHDDRYTMKDVSECIGDIGRAGSHIFSTLDLTAGFWQMPLDEKSRPYTAFTIPGLGQFQWTRGAMGLKGCPGSFQRLVELAVKGIPGIIVYIDDLLVHSKSHEEHRKILQLLFDRLRKVGLKANLKKCEFGATNVSYLGFRLTPDGILPGLDKLKVVREAKPPRTVTEIRQFLGLCNFFRTHVKDFARISAPLTQLTCKAVNWRNGILTPEAKRAFETLRNALISEPVVAYPRRNRPYSLIVDASTGGEGIEGGMGAILCQTDEQGKSHVIAYASRGLQKHEKNYTPFLAEMMAAVWGMNHFDVYLRGRHFTLYTDHRPLEKLGKVHTKTLNRLQEAMNEFDFTIVYKKGSEMPADFLSRNVSSLETTFEINNVEAELPNSELIREQEVDPFCSAVLKFIRSKTLPPDPQLAKLVKTVGPFAFLQKGVLWRRLERPGSIPTNVVMLPASLVPQIIQEAHGSLLTGHGGITKTKERLLQGFYWPSMEVQIAEFLKTCEKCQLTKTTDRPPPGPLFPLPQCTSLNQRMHCDLFGPLKSSDSGKKYVLCMTDAFSKYVEILAVPNKEVHTVSSAIFNRWICRFGPPLEIVTDQGKEFCAELSNKLYDLLRVKHTTTTPAHPQCNAQAEVANKTIAKYLANVVDSSTLDWEPYLPPLAFSYNTSVHRTVKATPYFLTYGVEPRIPGLDTPEFVSYGEDPVSEWLSRLHQARALASQNSWAANEKYKEYHDSRASPHKYQVGQQVLVDVRNFLGKNKKLAPNWEGPYPITRVWDNGVVDVKTPRREWRLNIQRLKPFFVSQLNPNDVEVPQAQVAPDPWANVPINFDTQPPPVVADMPPEPAQAAAPPPPPAQNRARGRPRKIPGMAPPPPVPPLDLEGRLTRAKARQMERAGLTPQLATGLINSINFQVIDNLVKKGVPLQRLILPMPTKKQWIDRRKTFLNRLNPAARNLLLTGDPAFTFDPVVYEFVMAADPLDVPLLVQQQLGYLSPPPSPPSSHNGSPQVSDDEFLSDNDYVEDNIENFLLPDTDALPDNLPPLDPSPAGTPPQVHRSPIPSPQVTPPPTSPTSPTVPSPYQRPSNPTPTAASRPYSKAKTNKKIDDAAFLFSRLTTTDLPGGHNLRSTDQPAQKPSDDNPFARRSALPRSPLCGSSSVRLSTSQLSQATQDFLRQLSPHPPPDGAPSKPSAQPSSRRLSEAFEVAPPNQPTAPRLPPRLSSLSRLTPAQREALAHRQNQPPDPPKKQPKTRRSPPGPNSRK